jgi:hypothetical protein
MSRQPQITFIVTADTRQAMSGFQNLTGAITGGVFKGGLALKAFDAGLGLIQNSVRSLTNSIAAATETQLKTISATATLSSLGGIGYEKAQTAVEELNNALAKSAASLPGVTDDYKRLAQGFSSSLIDAFKDPSGTLNIEGWKNATKDLSENFGALTAATTRDAGNTTLALNKALGGASTASLRQIAFFEQNKAVLDEIDKALKKENAKSLNDVSIETRVKILTAASQKLITDDFKKAAGESVDGLIQNFNTALFDPGSGIFGIMRDLQPDMKGTQSVFSAYNETLKLIVGSDGVLFGIGKILNQLGFQLDPMKVIFDGLTRFNAGISQVSSLVNDISNFVEQTGTKNATVLQSGLKALFGRFLGIVPDFKMPGVSTRDDYKSPSTGLKPILDMGAKISVGDIAAKVKDRIGGMVDSVFNKISEAVQTAKIIVNSKEFITGVTLIKRVFARVIIEDFLPGLINLGADLAILIADAITGLVIKPNAGDNAVIASAFDKALSKIDYGKLREAITKIIFTAVKINVAISFAGMTFAGLSTQVAGIVSLAILTPLRGALVAGLLNYGVPLAAAIIVPMQTAFAGIGGTVAVATVVVGRQLVAMISGIIPALGGGLFAGGLVTAGGLIAATTGSLYLAARLMGASNEDIASAAGNWATEASALTGIKIDGIGSAFTAGFEIIRLSVAERLSQLGTETGGEINNIWDLVKACFGGWGSLIQTGFDSIYNSVIISIADIRSNFSLWLSGIKNYIQSAFEGFISSFQNITTSVQSRINTFVKLVVDIWDNIVKAIQNAGLQLQNSLRKLPVIGGFIPSASPSPAVSPKPATPTSPATSPQSPGLLNQVLNLFSPKPKYAGQNIKYIQSFLEAVKTEAKNSPGASLVVANSNEVIIPKQSLPKIFNTVVRPPINSNPNSSDTSVTDSIFSSLVNSVENNYLNSIKKINSPVNAINSINSIKKINSPVNAINAINSVNPINSVNSVNKKLSSLANSVQSNLNSANNFDSINNSISINRQQKFNTAIATAPNAPVSTVAVANQSDSRLPQSVVIKQESGGRSLNIESINVSITNSQPSQPLSAHDISQQLGELLRYELSKLL